MALKVVNMAELRREIVLEAQTSGETITQICARYGISRQTFHFEERSGFRPASS